MSNFVKTNTSLINPIYTQTEPNQPIKLGRVPIQFDHEGVIYQDSAIITMRFQPEDRLEFFCGLEEKPPFLGHMLMIATDHNPRLTLTDIGITIDGVWTASGGKNDGILFRPEQSSVIVTHPSDSICAATFHLVNFPEFLGCDDYFIVTGEAPLQSFQRCGRAVLKTDGWVITIAAMERTTSLSKLLKSQGGYAITYVGQVTREDGAAFSDKQLEDVLLCLHYFLSFSLGCWISIVLPVGFDAEGNKVYERWGMARSATGPWNGSYSWFDPHHGELLSQVFPGFASLWKKEAWRNMLPRTLYWYLGACDRGVGIGVDTGLILAQSALELLAWTHLVLDQKIISRTQFKNRAFSAAKGLRQLMSSLNISQEIPQSLSLLQKNSWSDGPEAITKLRNSLTHPEALMNLPRNSYYEGWKLSLWYIDMILLRLCGHNGKYANRLIPHWVGTVESVPWSDEAK